MLLKLSNWVISDNFERPSRGQSFIASVSKRDFSYRCISDDKILTDVERHAVHCDYVSCHLSFLHQIGHAHLADHVECGWNKWRRTWSNLWVQLVPQPWIGQHEGCEEPQLAMHCSEWVSESSCVFPRPLSAFSDVSTSVRPITYAGNSRDRAPCSRRDQATTLSRYVYESMKLWT